MEKQEFNILLNFLHDSFTKIKKISDIDEKLFEMEKYGDKHKEYWEMTHERGRIKQSFTADIKKLEKMMLAAGMKVPEEPKPELVTFDAIAVLNAMNISENLDESFDDFFYLIHKSLIKPKELPDDLESYAVCPLTIDLTIFKKHVQQHKILPKVRDDFLELIEECKVNANQSNAMLP